MKDSITAGRIKVVHPLVRDRFGMFIDRIESSLGVTIRVVQGLRTFDEQAAIYAQGRTAPGKVVTNAKPGQSYHNYGLAMDIGVITPDGQNIDWNYDYGKFQGVARELDLIWGADWNNDGRTAAQGDTAEHLVDKPHYQYTLGHNWRELLALYQTGKFIPGTKYLALQAPQS